MIPHHAWVVLLRDDGTNALIRASRNAEVKVGNCRALADQLVGHPYGSTFEFGELDERAMPPGPHKSLEDLNDKRAKKRKNPLRYQKLIRVAAVSRAVESDEEREEVGSQIEETRDNRDYADNPNNQLVNSTDLRNQGLSGKEIVRTMAENLVTFKLKTKYSQEKYLAKLEKKHVPRVTVVRATSRTVSEVLFVKHQPNMSNDPLRSLRWYDSLPIMLSYGNVHAAAKCLVLDGTSGYLSLSILERLKEEMGGRCYFVGTTPREVKFGGGRPFIDFLNFPKRQLVSTFVVCSSKRLENGAVFKGELDDQEEGDLDRPSSSLAPSDQKDNKKKKKLPLDDQDVATNDNKVDEEEEDKSDDNGDDDPLVEHLQEDQGIEEEPAGGLLIEDAVASQTNKRMKVHTDEEWEVLKQVRAQRRQEMFDVLDVVGNPQQGADSLLIAARHDPLKALQVLLPHLGLGRPFVVHHPCLEPLMVAKAWLTERKSFVDLQVLEMFGREYQVLPNRTHPMMTGSAASGFLLKGIKITPWE